MHVYYILIAPRVEETARVKNAILDIREGEGGRGVVFPCERSGTQKGNRGFREVCSGHTSFESS